MSLGYTWSLCGDSGEKEAPKPYCMGHDPAGGGEVANSSFYWGIMLPWPK